MNILLLSTGTRNKIVQYFKQTLTLANGERIGKVVACDASTLAPSLYEADAHYCVPRIDDPDYISCILDICTKESIDGVLSLIDPELSLLAAHQHEFDSKGVTVIGSSVDACNLALDKMKMYEFCCDHHFNAAKSWVELDDFLKELNANTTHFPVFVKPQCGSASISISKVNDVDTLKTLFNHAAPSDHLMIQEFLDGQEYGADCYIDLISGELVSVFIKEKILMRAGETDKARSVKDEGMLQFIKDFVSVSDFRGQIDIDFFKIGNELYISEVNPRFGGGYPHAFACGVNHMQLICNNLNKQVNEPCFNAYDADVFMMKYNEIMTIK